MITIRFLKLATSMVILVCASCSQPLPLTSYLSYLADPTNGLIQLQQVNGVKVTCAFYPTSLVINQDLSRLPKLSSTNIRDSLVQVYSGKTYCALSFSRNGSEIENTVVTDPTAYQQVLSYLTSGIATDTYLVTTSHDSIPALTSMYLRQYGNTGHSTVLMVFDTSKARLEQGFHLTVQAQELGLGALTFFFAAKDLAALPALKFD